MSKTFKDRDGDSKRVLSQIWPVIGTAFTLELILCGFVVIDIIPSITALGLHIATVAWLGLRLRRSYRSAEDLRMPLLLCLTTLVMGPFGPAGTALTMCLKPWYERSALAFDKWYASLFPEEEVLFDSLLYRQIQSNPETSSQVASVVPFIDVLTFGTRQQKQAAVSLITAHFQPVFAPVLRLALNSDDSAIRV